MNIVASTSKGHVHERESNQHNEMYQNGSRKRKYYSENETNRTFYSKEWTRNRSLNRWQSDVLDIADESASFKRSRPMKRSQSTQSRNGKSYNSMHSEGNNRQQVRFVKQLGYKRLQDLCNNSPTEIVTFLINSTSGFEELLKTDLRPDHLVLVIKLLAKACSCDFANNKAALLTITCQSRLLENIQNHVFRMPLEHSDERKHTMGTFISDLLTYYETILNVLPNTASEKFKDLFLSTDIMMKSVQIHHTMNLAEQCEQFSRLDKQLQSMIEERLSKNVMCSKNELQKFAHPPDDFRGKSIYPTWDELFGEKMPFLRPNIIEGSYLDVEHYLDVQFRLLREDFVAPLREGLAKYLDESLENKKKYRIDNIRIYQNVRFKAPKVVNDVIGIIVCFNPQNVKNIKWEYSKRFMFGSLLLFTNDNFKHVIFGTVLETNINELKYGEVTVTLHQQSQKLNVYESPFLMVESEVYFEPYKHVLKALKEFNEDSFPMKNYIIFVQKESPPPKYLRQIPDFSYDVNEMKIQLLSDNSWPSELSLGLDKSQLAALRAALTQEFVVIQGPPGTGKTFLGLKVAKVLLQNAKFWNNSHSPILVVCYTNHALDQFLEGLLSTTKEIVRVGGQSKSSVLAQYNLRERRKHFNFGKANSHLKADYHDILSGLMRSIRVQQANLEELQKHRGIVSVKLLKKNNIISLQHSFCFEQIGWHVDELLQNWLMKGFEENYGHVSDTKEDRLHVDGEDVEGIAMEADKIRLAAEDDPILFDLGDIVHNLQYAIDLQVIEKEMRYLQTIFKTRKRSPSLNNYIFEEERFLYLQEVLKYLQTCLKMYHHSEAAYIQELHSVRNIWQLSVNDRHKLLHSIL